MKILTDINLNAIQSILIVNGILSDESIHGPYPVRFSRGPKHEWLVYNGFGVNLSAKMLDYNYTELQQSILNLLGKINFIYGD